MKIAIIGLPNSGKTTVFNALTRGQAETAAFSSGKIEPNQASVKVPDPRLDVLKDLYKPKKVTHAEVQYVDIGGLEGGDRQAGIPPEVINYIGTADAFLVVVRAFASDPVPHPAGNIDPARDLTTVEDELILSDLLVVDRRVEKLEKEIGKLPTAERAIRQVELQALRRLKDALESESPVRSVELNSQEEKLLRGFQFLSAKPVLAVVNIGEDDLTSEGLEFDGLNGRQAVALSARIEAELAQLEDQDAEEFMADLGISQPARNRVIEASYRLLGLISFLTVGEDEVRAWTIREGTSALDAAGVIHSDIQRGFIRAEVVPYPDLVEAGGMSEAKKHGKLRVEGKDYIVRDGDICHFLFNV
jgi:ribosome-binding ATPase